MTDKSESKKEHKKTEHKKVQHKSSSKKPMNVWMPIAIILAIVLVVGFFTGTFDLSSLVGGEDQITSAQASNKAISFINNNLLPEGMEAEYTNVNTTSGMYLVSFTIQGESGAVFISKDGSYLMPQVISLEAVPQNNNNQQQTSFDAPDTEIPVVKFFVMTFCPYGQQAENGLGPVQGVMGDKVEFEPHFVIYSDYATRLGAEWEDYCLDEEEKYCSMHGIKELNEGIRQLCIDKYHDADTWWDYVSYVNINCSLSDIETCWKDAAEANGIDVSEIETCQADEDETFAAAELALNQEYSVSGSPTIIINEELYKESRSADAFKDGICTGFTTVPEECSQALSTQSAANGSC